MSSRRVATALLACALACGAPDPRLKDPACTHARHRIRPDGLCDDAYTCVRPPGGRFDRIGLHRLAHCMGPTKGPVVLFLPGAHMNGEPLAAGAAPDVRATLVGAAVRVWSLDYRTHAVPDDADADELDALADWTADAFADDAAFAARWIRDADRGPLWLAGFSWGAGLAYRLAARGEPVAGLVVLDGSPPDGAAPAGTGPAIDVGGSRLPYPQRKRLLAAVLADPAAPSPVWGFPSAGGALATIVYEARAFGGHGGLSAARDGVTDVHALAALMDGYDRWWPRAALAGDAVTPSHALPVVAFASSNMGAAWTERVRAGALAFGGAHAVVHELPHHGHLDVLIARDAPTLVADPAATFIREQSAR